MTRYRTKPLYLCPTCHHWTHDEEPRNATLSAAAPAMLAALQECITEPGAACFRDLNWRDLSIRIGAISTIARAAIALAKGE